LNCYDNIPEKNNLNEERFILAHSFRSFGAWSSGSIAFRLVARKKLYSKNPQQRRASHLMTAPSGRKKEREQNIPFKSSNTCPSELLLPTRPLFLVFITF
jgi:hypothetical protein